MALANFLLSHALDDEIASILSEYSLNFVPVVDNGPEAALAKAGDCTSANASRKGSNNNRSHFELTKRCIWLNFRVAHLLAGLGWVDSDLRSSQAGGPPLQLSTAQAG